MSCKAAVRTELVNELNTRSFGSFTASARGSGSLPVVLLLLAGATLLWVYANRALVFEVRSAAATVRASLALEAAQAGLAWGLARLNDTTPLDTGCTAVATDGRAFIDQMLPVDPADPQRRRLPGTAWPGCVQVPASGWQCQCPTEGRAALGPPAASDAAAPAFLLRFAAGARPGQAWLHSEGCSNAAPPCAATGGRSDAHRPVDLLLGLLAALPRPPYATVNAVGTVQTTGPVQIANTAPGASWTVAAGGTVTLDAVTRLSGAAGQPGATTTVANDRRALQPDGAPVTPDRWFAAHFALAPAAYRGLPHVHVLPCGTACDAGAVTTALNAGHRVLWADGDLRLDSLAAYGTAADPVLLVAAGALRITAPVSITGYVHAGSVDWDSPAASGLQGALNSAGAVRLSGPLRLVRHEPVLAQLRHATGTWAPAPGSWND